MREGWVGMNDETILEGKGANIGLGWWDGRRTED